MPRPPLPADAGGDAVQQRLVEAGIIGMGGAGFPSHVKVKEGLARTVQLVPFGGDRVVLGFRGEVRGPLDG